MTKERHSSATSGFACRDSALALRHVAAPACRPPVHPAPPGERLRAGGSAKGQFPRNANSLTHPPFARPARFNLKPNLVATRSRDASAPRHGPHCLDARRIQAFEATQIFQLKDIILPRRTNTLTTRAAQGMREMIAGLVLVSAVVGMGAVAVTLALSLPIWAVVISYPVVCSLTLLTTAAVWSIRSRQSAGQPILRTQA